MTPQEACSTCGHALVWANRALVCARLSCSAYGRRVREAS